MLDSLTKVFSGLGLRWHSREYADDDLTKAIGVWIGYPSFREAISGRPGATEQERSKARYALDVAHMGAAKLLLEFAERLGIDGGPIWESARLCQDLYDRDPCLFRCLEHWPGCLDTSGLSQSERCAVRSGESAFMRLVTKSNINLEEIGNTQKKSLPKDPDIRDFILGLKRVCPTGVGIHKLIREFCKEGEKNREFGRVKKAVYDHKDLWRDVGNK